MRFKATGWTGLAILLAAVLTLPMVSAQTIDDQSVEGRLLEILRQKGVIDDAEFDELRKLETELREESSLEAELEDEISAMVARIGAEQPVSGYKIGKGFSWTTPDKMFSLTIGGRLQVRFTYDFYDDNPGTNNENEPDFDVPRARITLAGRAFEYFKYKFQFDIAGDEADTPVMGTTYSSRNRLTELKDAYVDFVKWDPFNIRAGQFKAPYFRQELTSSGKQEFVDRSINSRVFAPGRSTGVMIFGSLGGEDDHLFEYYAAAMDGEGENRTNNDEGLMWIGRAVVNPFGALAYSESDLRSEEKREQFLMAVGVDAWYHQDDNHQGDPDDWSIGGDVTAVWYGFFVTVQVDYRENGVDNASDVEIFGWMTQLGYTIIPETFEIALRAANIDWDNSNNQSAQREYLVVLGYFMEQHNLKIQADFGRVELHFHDHNDNVNDWRLRVQFQIVF